MQIIKAPAVNLEVRFPWSRANGEARWPILEYLERYDRNADDVGDDDIVLVARGLTPEQAEQAIVGIQEIAREYGLFL